MGWSAAVLVTLAEIVTSPPKTRMGPAMLIADPIVTAVALPDLPSVRPVSVDANV